jgi:hypothetical protein
VSLRVWVAPIVVLMLTLSGCVSLTPGDTPALGEPEWVVIEVGGGTIEVPKGFQAGPRFGKPVPLPDHLVNPWEPDPENRVPGDGHDDGLLILQRRHTDRSYYDMPWTGGARITNVHGTPENPICICDAVFVLGNRSGLDPTGPYRISFSSHILVDNITLYGGGLGFWHSNNIIVTRSTIIDGTIRGDESTDVWIHDNDFYAHRGLLEWYDHPPVLDQCWPSPPRGCLVYGIFILLGGRWLVEHNHFDTPGGIWGIENTDSIARHNTLYNGGAIHMGPGTSEVSWNLIRGHGRDAVHFTPTYGIFANNSIILNHAIDRRDRVYDAQPNIVAGCSLCIVENNDFIGYGIGRQAGVMPPALWINIANVVANGNYWGTIHDPRLPPDTWIRIDPSSTLVVDNWALEPNHPVSYGVFANPQDLPYHYEEVTGTDWPIHMRP